MDSAGSPASTLEIEARARGGRNAEPARGKVLLLVENHSVPADRRVWGEALSLRRAGFRVSVICPRGRFTDKEPYEARDGVAIYRFPMPFEGNRRLNYLLEYAWALLACFGLSLRVLRARGFDVLHVGNPPDLFFPLAWFYKLLGKKFIFDQHDLCPETYLSKFPDAGTRLSYRMLLWTEKLTYRASDVVIVTNQSYRDVALQRGGVAPDRIFIVRNSPNLALFKPQAPDPAWRDGCRYLVAFVGIMAAQDGVDYLLRAAHHVVHELGRTDIRFVLVGTGPAWDDLQKLHAELGLEPYVRFTGRIPDEPMLRVLSSADLCASPDPYNPLNDVSTMTKLMEFMALGKASVSFELKEARYSAQDASVYVPDNDWRRFGDAIVELLDDPERRARMAEAGLRRIRGELSWARSEENLRAAYDRALGLQPAPARSASA
jgi:glycosyltransferase involved in cell wall biosynthesis